MKRPHSPVPVTVTLAAACLLARAAEPAKYVPDFTRQPDIPALSPEDELKTIQLPPGYSLELVLSEKDGVKEPVSIAFDGNGRMYIAEMRTYMQDLDATGQHEPLGVVSRHESSKRDGNYDTHRIFRDKLVLPRMILPLDDRVLINETHSNDLVAYRDTNGDGVSEEKTMWFPGGPRGGNMEHQQSGLLWGMDNWLYQTVNAYRLRWNGDGPPLQEKIPSGGGQWGLAQDDDGKIWWSNGGGEKGLWRFQTPILYGAYDVPGQFPPGFKEVWPLVGLADFQSGPMRVRMPDKTLNHFSASCGQEVVRVDRLPEEIRGDVLISEPVGRLVRRAKVTVEDGITKIHNPHGNSEFIRSTDPNFRIVNMVNGPDGCLYLVDMYRGVIQEGNWTKPDSYLRKVLEQYGMEKVVGKGRIWRLVHQDFKPGPQPRMLDESAAELVRHLEHPNGWWRDTAQKLLVLKGDRSVVPRLLSMARGSGNELGRIHALWTLEGLGALDRELVSHFLRDPNPRLKVHGLRAGETLFRAGDPSLLAEVRALGKDTSADVVLQVLMTGKILSAAKVTAWGDHAKFAQSVMLASPSAGVKQLGTMLLNNTDTVGGRWFTPEENAMLEKGRTIYSETCFACHGFDGRGMPMEGLAPGTTIAPPLAGSETIRSHPDAIVHVMLSGMSGPIRGKTYDSMMVPMNTNDDEWIAAVSSYVRNAFGNGGAMVKVSDVARIRAAEKNRSGPWTVESLRGILPQALPKDAFSMTASEAEDDAALALDGDPATRWTTGDFQTVGTSVELSLGGEHTISGLRLDQVKSAGDFPGAYVVESSNDGKTWSRLAAGKGTPKITEINFPPVTASRLRIKLAGIEKGKPWSIHELDVLHPGESR